MSTPPSSTPSDPPPDATKPKKPIAFARSPVSVKRTMISESDDRRGDRAADALDGARDDEHPLRARQAARQRAEREQRDPVDEHPAMPEQVAEAPAEQQQAAKVSR